MKRTFRHTAVLFAVCVLVVSGCSNTVPQIRDGVTPPPVTNDAAVTGAPQTEQPENTQDAAKTTVSPGNIDALGNPIMTGDHFTRYISFSDILVYEENGETLVDCIVTNDYPQLLLCAVNIEFYNDEGEVIASGSLQAPDGSFLLALGNGNTHLYARILTDTVLTDKVFKLIFDPQTGVVPE